ncbi:MerR family transcriptional regulator [Paenibacillus sp. N4]|uniref:MerR family transcriptional regulator n=1 Tax=Paenibacillus vietnamensis TaxID=2590547 RepID=UPI001CD0FA76|nr:MerR family transcriptional regulator [Paenibacillus vietnamensis]MCA0755947.1 MerR family transcriptional regulator [Paenibacillus vietnamensis]
MGNLKTKDAADLISVSQTTIKRWASTFPDVFQKDRFGHYIFSEDDVLLLMLIKERIEQGEQLDRMQLTSNMEAAASRQDEASVQEQDEASLHVQAAAAAADEMLNRIEQMERTLQQKADEVVSVQLLQQREELEELRQMIVQLAAAVETLQTPAGKGRAQHEELHPVAAAKLQEPPKKRGLLRSFFSLL